VSVVFAHIDGIDIGSGDRTASDVVAAMQRAVGVAEGDVNKILVDDKGMLCLAVFGLPPLVHVDDATRATAAAHLCVSEVKALGCHLSVGVTTGVAFCGLVGSELRREYTVMGSSVNLAARLMCYAKKDDACVLVDDATRAAVERQAVRRAWDFTPMAPMSLKGIGDDIRAFAPSPVATASAVPGLGLARVPSSAGDEPPERRRASILETLFRSKLDRFTHPHAKPAARAKALLRSFAEPHGRLWKPDARPSGGVVCLAGGVGSGSHAIVDEVCAWAEETATWTLLRVNVDDTHAHEFERVRLGFASGSGSSARAAHANWMRALRFARGWVLAVAEAAGTDWRSLVPDCLAPFAPLVADVVGESGAVWNPNRFKIPST